MSWHSDWSTLSAATNIGVYNFLISLWEAGDERHRVVNGDTRYPPGVSGWANGTISAISTDGTHITVTYSAGNWIDDLSVGRWGPGFGGTFDGVTLSPVYEDYQIVLDSEAEDPNDSIWCEITHTASDTTVKILDDGTQTLNRTLASYVGTEFEICASGTGRVSRAQRWLPRPNDRVIDWGAITASTATTLTATTAVGTPTTKSWTISEHVGKQVIFIASGKWKRLSISANIATDLTFSTAGTAPTGEFWIVEPGAWFRPAYRYREVEVTNVDGQKILVRDPATENVNPFQWYRGVLREYLSHNPVDTLAGASVAETTVDLVLGEDVEFCALVENINVFDDDYYIPSTDVCNANPDSYLAPEFHWSIRAIQKLIEDLCGSFIERKSYSGATAIPNLTVATLFKKIRPARTRTGTITAVPGGNATVTWDSALPATSVGVHWTVLGTDGDVVITGNASDSPGTATSTTFTCGYTFTAPDIGRTIVISWGWIREVPLAFKYLYRRDWFFPGSDEGDPVFPPTVDAPGEWLTTGPSTVYGLYDKFGRLEETGSAFASGDAARYHGDSFHDPTTLVQSGDGDGWAFYQDKAWVGVPGYNTGWFEPAKSGTITSGNAFSFTDSATNWWETASVVHTGTSTGGSTTTLIDTGKAADAFWLSMSGQRFVGMVLEVSFDAQVTWEKRIVTSASGTTLTVNAAYSATASGKPYRIREPGYILNRWRDRKCIVTQTDGTQVELDTLYSDDKSAFFATQAFTFLAGWTYEFIEDKPNPGNHEAGVGGVYHFTGGEWLKPTDDGVTQDTRGADWHVNQNENLEHKEELFDGVGNRYRMGDIISIELLLEMYDAMNALTAIKRTLSWRARTVTGTPENNHKTGSAVDVTFASVRTATEADYAGYAADEEAGVPYSHAQITASYEDPSGVLAGTNAALTRRTAVGYITNAPTSYSSSVEFLAYSMIDVTNNNQNLTTPPNYIGFDDSFTGLEYRKYTSYDTNAASSDAERVSARLGTLDAPSWPPNPPSTSTDGPKSSTAGYYIRDGVAIFRFDVSGGFSFVG